MQRSATYDVAITTIEKESKDYIKYTDERLGRLKVTPDFLPAPAELAFREEGVKVTIALSKRSVDFFKREAQRYGTQYQRMIRRLLDNYTQLHSERPLTTRSSGRPRTPQRRKQDRGNPVRGRR